MFSIPTTGHNPRPVPLFTYSQNPFPKFYRLTSFSAATLQIFCVHLLFLSSGPAYRNTLYSTILTILGDLMHHEIPSHVME